MFESSRRAKLESVRLGETTHPGLWFEKYLRSSKKGNSRAKQDLVDEVIRATKGVGELYRDYFQRYKEALAGRPGLTFAAKGRTDGRLSVGLGASAVLETSITLHRTYGVPYIPGSALKGLASSYAAKYWKDEGWSRSFNGGKTERGKLQELIFGTTDESGLVIFFDALPDPEGEDAWELNPDVITVHHPDYYRGKEKDKPPADWDSPTPVPFITARGTFHFFLGLVPLPESELEAGKKVLMLAGKLLQQALEKEGVGAKTTIGYGRFRFDEGEAFRELEPPPPKRSKALEDALERARHVKWSNDIVQRMQKIAELWSQIPDQEKPELEAFLKAEKTKVLGHPMLKKARKKDPKLDALMKKLGL